MSEVQAAAISEAARDLLRELKKDAVALVDAWDFSDFEMKSTLGTWDGRYAERLYNSAQRNPLNAPDPRMFELRAKL